MCVYIYILCSFPPTPREENKAETNKIMRITATHNTNKKPLNHCILRTCFFLMNLSHLFFLAEVFLLPLPPPPLQREENSWCAPGAAAGHRGPGAQAGPRAAGDIGDQGGLAGGWGEWEPQSRRFFLLICLFFFYRLLLFLLLPFFVFFFFFFFFFSRVLKWLAVVFRFFLLFLFLLFLFSSFLFSVFLFLVFSEVFGVFLGVSSRCLAWDVFTPSLGVSCRSGDAELGRRRNVGELKHS